MINVNPEEAKGWWSILKDMGKTKFGVGALVFLVTALICIGVIRYSFKETIEDLRKQIAEQNKIINAFPDKLEKVRDEENKNCVATYREYFQLFAEQQNAIQKAKENERELEELRSMVKQLLNKS